jgi:hypothetical protein
VATVSILLRAPACCIASWENVLLEIWRYAPNAFLVIEKNRITREFVAKSRARACSLSIIEPTSPPPDERARAQLAKFSSEIVPTLAVAIIVAEGGGFRAALIRGVGTALTVLLPHRVPFKFVTSVQQGIDLVLPYLSSGSKGAPGLRLAIDEVRAQLSPSVPLSLR